MGIKSLSRAITAAALFFSSVVFSGLAIAEERASANSQTGFCFSNSCEALIISLDNYQNRKVLSSSERGSDLVANSLRRKAFNVYFLNNPNKAEILEELQRFKSKSDVDISLIYFTGLGEVFGDGRKYLGPSDTSTVDDQIRESMIPVSAVYQSHPGSALNVNILNTAFLDINFFSTAALLSEPTTKELRVRRKPDDENFLDGVGADVETLFIFSAELGEKSFDTITFASAVAEAVEKPGDIIRSFAQLRDRVAVESYLAQFPELQMRGIQSRPICLSTCEVDSSYGQQATSSRLKALEAGACSGSFSSSAKSKNRIALLVGNNGYRTSAWAKLGEPVQDAKTINSALVSSGFETRVCENLGLDRLEEEIENFKAAFRERAEKRDGEEVEPTALFYFSGHGAADAESSLNYLIPVDSKAESAETLRGEAVSIDKIAEGLETSQGQVVMVIDACRNPLKRGRTKTGSGDKGLVPFRRRPNMLLASATRPGEVAIEQSGYAAFLAERISKVQSNRYESEISLVFRDVGQRVYEATGGEQQPVTEGQLRGRFFFQD